MDEGEEPTFHISDLPCAPVHLQGEPCENGFRSQITPHSHTSALLLVLDWDLGVGVDHS